MSFCRLSQRGSSSGKVPWVAKVILCDPSNVARLSRFSAFVVDKPASPTARPRPTARFPLTSGQLGASASDITRCLELVEPEALVYSARLARPRLGALGLAQLGAPR